MLTIIRKSINNYPYEYDIMKTSLLLFEKMIVEEKTQRKK